MAIPPVLRALLTAHGPSGYETAPAAAFREAASAYAEVTTDVMGSVWARVPGTGGGPTLAIVGHIDEIGLIVTHIDDNGFLRFIGVGGWDPQILVGQRVSVATREGEIAGVVGRKPIHLLKDDDRKKVARLEELHIDIGAKDGDEARGTRARRRRGGHRGRARRAAQRSRRRALDGQPPGLLRRLRGRAARPRGGRRAGRRRGGRRRAGGDDLRRVADDRLRAASRPGHRGRRDARHRRARRRRQRARRARLRLGAGHRARVEPQPARRRAALRDRRGRGDPVHGPGLRALHRHRRRRHALLARGASRAAASACRCATCTRRSRWCSSRTSPTLRGSSPQPRSV